MKLSRVIFSAFVAIAAVPMLSRSAPLPPQNAPSSVPAATTGLMLSARVDSTESNNALQFHVSFENTSDTNLVLNLGMMLGNGRIQLPEAIRLVVVDETGYTRELHFADKNAPGVAGRIDDYAVPLRAGSTHSLKLELRDFWCPKTKEHSILLPPGAYEVRAQFIEAGSRSPDENDGERTKLRYWKGTLESAVTTFSVGKNE